MLTKKEAISRAKELASLVKEEASNTEINGRVSDSVIDLFCEMELPQILTPKKFGGHEFDYRTFSGIISEIAPISTSTAWVLSFYIGHNYIHALFPEQSQEEVFHQKPYSLTPGTIAPNFSLTPVDGGYIANGTSQWNSGSSRADWFLNNGFIRTEGKPPEARLFLVPMKDVQIIENWDVLGMRGTASYDIKLEDVYVPHHHIASTADVLNGNSPGSKIHENPIYSMPLLPVIMGEVIPVVVGAYKGAAATYRSFIQSKLTAYTGQKVATKQTAQIRVGKSEAGAQLAHSMLEDYIRDIDGLDINKWKSIEARASCKARASLIVDFCTQGVNDLILGAGAGSFRNDSPLQPFYRDLNMLRVHGLLDMEPSTEVYGGILLGNEPSAIV